MLTMPILPQAYRLIAMRWLRCALFIAQVRPGLLNGAREDITAVALSMAEAWQTREGDDRAEVFRGYAETLYIMGWGAGRMEGGGNV